MLLSSLLFNTDSEKPQTPTVLLSALFHQSAAVQHVTEQKQSCVLSTRSRREAVYVCSVQRAAGQTADPVCSGPYVSYEGRQAAVVSPQSVDLEASSAPLRCYATQVWPRPGSVGCLVGRSRCIRRRCRWGSAGIKKHTNRPQTVKSACSFLLFMNLIPVHWRPPSTV